MRRSLFVILAALAATASLATAQGKAKGKAKGSAPGSSAGTPSSPFSGTVLSREWSICGGPSLVSLLCADIQVDVAGTTTTVRVRNFSGAPEITAGGASSAGEWVLTTVGFDGIAESAGTFVAGVGATSGPWLQRTPESTAPAAWVAHDDKQVGGGVTVDLAVANPNGVGAGIASSCAATGSLPGGSNKLWISAVAGCDGYTVADAAANDGWFEVSVQTVDTWDPNAAGVSAFFKGQNGPGGASYSCSVGGATPTGDCVDAGTYVTQTVGGPGGVVPEPQTVVLVATGLVGVFAPTIRRRVARRNEVTGSGERR
jgi:hypothetical protein